MKSKDKKGSKVAFNFGRAKRQYRVLLCALSNLGDIPFTTQSTHLAPSKEAAVLVAYEALRNSMTYGFTVTDVKTWVLHGGDQ